MLLEPGAFYTYASDFPENPEYVFFAADDEDGIHLIVIRGVIFYPGEMIIPDDSNEFIKINPTFTVDTSV